METTETTGDTARQPGARRARRRAFRPLLLWLLGSAMLLAWDWHQKSVAGTTITFRLFLEGQPMVENVAATLDGQPFRWGKRVRVGWRTLAIAHPETEPWQRSVFVWFGENDLGNINLTRSRGTLKVRAVPPPKEIRVAGRLSTGMSTNATCIFYALPVGEYRITATFAHSTETRTAQVRRQKTSRLLLQPPLGSLDLTTEPTDAEFRFTAMQFGGLDIAGKAPARLAEVPAGEYRLSVWRGNYVQEARVEIKTGETNRQHVAFAYGEVQFLTTPAGAAVFKAGRAIGTTPHIMRDVQPGRHAFALELDGYLPVEVTVGVKGKDVIVVRTNLVSRKYASAMESARRIFNSRFANLSDKRTALAQVAEALQAAPGDAEAMALQEKIAAAVRVQEQTLAEEQARAAAAKAAEKRAQEAAAQIARTAAARDTPNRLATPAREREAAEYFEKLAEKMENGNYFDLNVWRASAGLSKVREALRRYVAQGPDKWKLAQEVTVAEQTIVFRLEPQGTASDRKYALVQVCALAEETTEIRCKISLYTVMNPLSGKWVPVHQQFYFPNDPSQAARWRARVTAQFKEHLAKELGAALQ